MCISFNDKGQIIITSQSVVENLALKEWLKKVAIAKELLIVNFKDTNDFGSER